MVSDRKIRIYKVPVVHSQCLLYEKCNSGQQVAAFFIANVWC